MNLRCHRLVRAVLVAAVLGTFFVVPAANTSPPAAASIATEIGRLPRVPADAVDLFGPGIIPKWHDEPNPHHYPTGYNALTGTMIVLPEHRRLWQFFPYRDEATSPLAVQVAVRDLDTLRIVDTFELGFMPRRAGGDSANSGEFLTAVGDGKVYFMSEQDPTGYNLTEVHVGTLQQRQVPFTPAGLGGFGVIHLGGLAYDEGSNELWGVLGASKAASAGGALNTFLIRRELDTGAVSGPRPVRSCDGPLPGANSTETYATPPMVTEDNIYLVCHRTGYSGAVTRVKRSTAFDNAGEEDLTVGPPYLESVLIDHGHGRLFLTTKAGEIWAFDVATMSFVGIVAAEAPRPGQTAASGYGLDPVTGRVFFHSPSHGTGIAEGRFFPIPQARTLAHTRSAGQERIWSDAHSGRFFVLAGKFFERADDWIIYRADPAPVPPARPDPDRNTLDRPEAKGETDARFFSGGSGYGARVLLAKGMAAVVPSPSAGLNSPVAQAINDRVNSKCGYTDRELVAGRVSKTEYDTGSTAAQAVAVGIDNRTVLDLERPPRCDITVRNSGTEYFSGVFATAPAAAPLVENQGDEPRWNRDPAVCSSSEGGTRAEGRGDDHGAPPLGTSHVVCPLPGGEMTAHAETRLEGGVSVGRASSSTRILRDADGVHSRVEAVAGDIDIAGGAIRIGEVRSVAVSTSNGRPQAEPMSTHTVTIRGVSIAGQHLCTDHCDPVAVAAALNQAAAGRAQFRVGDSGLDRRLVEGTPGGALTAVQKSVERQVSDQALVGDFTTEIPGLEMVVYNDNFAWGRARQLYQFAGVASSATYNIVEIPKGAGFPGAPPRLPSAGGVLDSLGGAGATGAVDGTGDRSAELVGLGSSGGGTGGPSGVLPRIARTISDGFRLLLTNPREAALLFTGWLLLALPIALALRRRLLAALPH